MPPRSALLRSLGRRVARLRRARGLSQEQLAERMRWRNPDYVSRIERGLENLTVTSATKLAHALGVSVVSLLERSSGRSNSK